MCGLDFPSLYKILRKNRLELSNSKPVSLRSLSCSNRLPKRPEHAESLHRRFIPKRFPSFITKIQEERPTVITPRSSRPKVHDISS